MYHSQSVYFYLLIKMQASFSHTLFMVRKNCVAAIGAMCFLCVASAAHFFILWRNSNETDNQRSNVNSPCIHTSFWFIRIQKVITPSPSGFGVIFFYQLYFLAILRVVVFGNSSSRIFTLPTFLNSGILRLNSLTSLLIWLRASG